MTKIEFNGNDYPTLGVELELGIIDSGTMALSSVCDEVLGDLKDAGTIDCKPELMQSCIEINTGICRSVSAVRQDLAAKLQATQSVMSRRDLQLWWGGTHPFSHWEEQQVTKNKRYLGLVESLQEMARRMITFGLHVHVGVESGDKAVMICDRIMQYLPTLLSLSCSSPFWEARDTGLQSFRTKILEGLPTAGLPTLMRNWSEYVWLVNHLQETGFIQSIREIWWDVRPHHNFGTVEIRVCDMPCSLDDVCGITALVQCLVRYLSDEIDHGTYQFTCHPMMIRQNKWRACRYGLNAALVNSFTYQVEQVTSIVDKLVQQLGDIAVELRCETELAYVKEMTRKRSWSDQQRAILKETNDAREIVRRLSQTSFVS